MEFVIKNTAPFDIERAGRVFRAGKERHINVTKELTREIYACKHLTIIQEIKSNYESRVETNISRLKIGYIPDQPVSIIIPVYNGLEYLKKCIKSVREYTQPKSYELVIVDNGSDKKTKIYIKRLRKNVKVITNDCNKGFAYACSQGIKVASYKYYCLLNTDTIVTPGWLNEMMKAMKLPNAGIIGPSTLMAYRKPQGLLEIDTEGKLNEEVKRVANIPEDDLKVEDLISLSEELKEEYIEADNITGFCYLIRQEVIERIGVFDYRSFPIGGGEEIDYNRRAREAGFKLYTARKSYVHHFRHKTIMNLGLNIKSLTKSNTKAKERNKALNKIFIANNTRIDKGITRFNRAVVTANMGENDKIVTEHYDNPSFDFILFTDREIDSDKWDVRVVRRNFTDSRREARMYKWLIHRFLDIKYSLWIDANMSIRADIDELIRKYLSNSDIAIHLHGRRNCIYDEAEVCSDWKFDHQDVIERQMARYKKEGYPEGKGLFETGVLLRRHTKEVKEFNEAVWAEICSGSVRDQLSTAYIAWKMRIKINLLEGQFANGNTKFKLIHHLKENRKYEK